MQAAAAHGLHGLQAPHAALAAQGLQGLHAETFFAAHGLQAPQAALAAQGLQASGFFAAHGLAAQDAVLGVERPAERSSAPPAAPASANGTTATVVSSFDLIVAIKRSSTLPACKRRLGCLLIHDPSLRCRR
ncbi:hypothetical protein [Hoeflea sp.]|uniref:hypothetical protein n=1 Tax=Hoeflea sp. TaxID=1940281 RepID=UPI003B0278F9